ncbi:MAG: transposase-like protein [Paracoccaceae bacterium]
MRIFWQNAATVCHETIRDSVAKFGTQIAAKIRRGRPRPADKWHLDGVVTLTQLSADFVFLMGLEIS